MKQPEVHHIVSHTLADCTGNGNSFGLWGSLQGGAGGGAGGDMIVGWIAALQPTSRSIFGQNPRIVGQPM